MELLGWMKRRGAEREAQRPDSTQPPLAATPTSTHRPYPERSSNKASASPDAYWLPAGQPVTIAGYMIGGGLVYVGRELPTVSGDWQAEPALIDPGLPAQSHNPDWAGAGLSYWPSYAEIPPASRAAYLAWLADGRRYPVAPIGYVFLFFYGLERRLLADAEQSTAARAEVGVITGEVERLLSIYGHNHSFRGYASEFLATVDVLQTSTVRAYAAPPPQPGTTWELPPRLKLGLGQLAADGKPIPPEWALAWVQAHPEIRLRTPASRCREEFARLFELRYGEQFEGGLIVKPNRTRLTLSYRPASASFSGSLELVIGELPDITVLNAPIRKLAELADQCCDELDAYSRFLGKHAGDRSSLAATALLPDALAADITSHEAADLFDWVEGLLGPQDMVVIDAGDLIARWPAATGGKLAKAEAVLLAQLLAKRGYGIEPDVRFGGSTLSPGRAVLFRLGSGAPTAASPAYQAAMVLLHLAALVSDADREVTEAEKQRLTDHVEAALHLSTAERQRLHAHLAWLLAASPGLTGIKRRLAALDHGQRAGIGRFLVTVAAADGTVSPPEITILQKLYRLLELDAAEIYRQVHALTATPPPAAGPITVRPAAAAQSGYAIPPPPPAPQAAGVVLDAAWVEAKLAETAAVSALLGSIFVEEEEEAPAWRPVEPAAAEQTVVGLDAAHSALLRALTARPSWSRNDFETLAEQRALLPDGALDAINEAALEACGEPVCDGDDPIDVNTNVLQELLA
jgi:tellurite resistance protein